MKGTYLYAIFLLIASLLSGCALAIDSKEQASHAFIEDAQSIFKEIDKGVEQGRIPNQAYEDYNTFLNQYVPYNQGEAEILTSFRKLFKEGEVLIDRSYKSSDSYLQLREDLANQLDVSIQPFQDTGVDAN